MKKNLPARRVRFIQTHIEIQYIPYSNKYLYFTNTLNFELAYACLNPPTEDEFINGVHTTSHNVVCTAQFILTELKH